MHQKGQKRKVKKEKNSTMYPKNNLTYKVSNRCDGWYHQSTRTSTHNFVIWFCKLILITYHHSISQASIRTQSHFHIQ